MVNISKRMLPKISSDVGVLRFILVNIIMGVKTGIYDKTVIIVLSGFFTINPISIRGIIRINKIGAAIC